jgi:hypothetical protein
MSVTPQRPTHGAREAAEHFLDFSRSSRVREAAPRCSRGAAAPDLAPRATGSTAIAEPPHKHREGRRSLTSSALARAGCRGPRRPPPSAGPAGAALRGRPQPPGRRKNSRRQTLLLDTSDLVTDEPPSLHVPLEFGQSVGRDWFAFGRAQCIQPLLGVSQLRIEAPDPEPDQCCFHTIDEPALLANQALALAAWSLSILLSEGRNGSRLAMITLAPQPAHKGTLQELCVEPIRLSGIASSPVRSSGIFQQQKFLIGVSSVERVHTGKLSEDLVAVAGSYGRPNRIASALSARLSHGNSVIDCPCLLALELDCVVVPLDNLSLFQEEDTHAMP